jgi:hypothetical protein
VAGEGKRWHRIERVEREFSDLEHFRAGDGMRPVDQPCPVSDNDHAGRIGFGDVVDANQSGHLDTRADLLHALARSGLSGGFVVIDESAGQAPQAVARLNRTTAQDNPAGAFDDHRR